MAGHGKVTKSGSETDKKEQKHTSAPDLTKSGAEIWSATAIVSSITAYR